MTLENEIKDFARKAGVSVVGIAGPERLSGPPSIDPTFTMPGARSVVSMVMPMEIPAIYDFLGKKSSGPHNIDQIKKSQKMYRLSNEVAEFIINKGFRAKSVAPNNTYVRSLDMLSTRPIFSHRFGAVVSGLGTFGISGNVVTREFGAAVYLGTVVTDALLNSDPILPARDAMDNRCRTCKLCDKSCTLHMFSADEEEYLLLNGVLHARGKRDNLDLCNMPCFGLHGISSDKKWSNWGRHWIMEYVERMPDPHDRIGVRRMMMKAGPASGDGGQRYDLIQRFNSMLWPREKVEDLLPEYESMPAQEEDIAKLLTRVDENMGITGLKDPYVLTCGQCALVCGPDFNETKKRFDLLLASGYVVQGADGRMVRVNTYEEARALKLRYQLKVGRRRMVKDSGGLLWVTKYFGFNARAEWHNWLYQRKASKTCAEAGLAGKEATAPTLFLGFIGLNRKARNTK
jgi:hypothetical protein